MREALARALLTTDAALLDAALPLFALHSVRKDQTLLHPGSVWEQA